jgi:hypothetical protein
MNKITANKSINPAIQYKIYLYHTAHFPSYFAIKRGKDMSHKVNTTYDAVLLAHNFCALFFVALRVSMNGNTQNNNSETNSMRKK